MSWQVISSGAPLVILCLPADSRARLRTSWGDAPPQHCPMWSEPLVPSNDEPSPGFITWSTFKLI